jgi:hypothetical protein
LPPLPAPSHPVASRQSHKRCRNARLKQSGFCLQFPTFREGYGEIAATLGLRPRMPPNLASAPV